MSKRNAIELTEPDNIVEDNFKKPKYEDTTTTIKRKVEELTQTETEEEIFKKQKCIDITVTQPSTFDESDYFSTKGVTPPLSFTDYDGNDRVETTYIGSSKTVKKFTSDKLMSEIHYCYREDGTKYLEKVFFVFGIPVINEISFNRNEQITRSKSWHVNSDHGKVTLWIDSRYREYSRIGNGRLMKQTCFDITGFETDRTKFWNDENETTSTEIIFTHTEDTVTTYYMSGDIGSTTVYVHDDSKLWFKQSVISKIGYYKNGATKTEFNRNIEDDSTVTKQFYKNTQLMLERVNGPEGVFVSNKTFFLNGNMQSYQFYDDVGDYVTETWYRKGQLRWEECYTKLNQLQYSVHYDRRGNEIKSSDECWP